MEDRVFEQLTEREGIKVKGLGCARTECMDRSKENLFCGNLLERVS